MVYEIPTVFEDPLLSSGGGIDFFPTEDIVAGLVDTSINPDASDYMGEIGEFSFIASGPPLMRGLIRQTIKAAMYDQGLTWLQIDIMETTTKQFMGLPVWGNYTVKVYFHGSPILAVPAIAFWGIIAAVLVIGITVAIWQLSTSYQAGQSARKVDVTLDYLTTEQTRVTNLPAGPAKDAEQKNLDDLKKKSVTALTAPGGDLAPKGAGTNWGQLALIGIIVFGVFAATGAIKTLKGSTA